MLSKQVLKDIKEFNIKFTKKPSGSLVSMDDLEYFRKLYNEILQADYHKTNNLLGSEKN